MANKTANLKYSLTYEGPGGETVSVAQATIACPYQAQSVGTVDVPDATASATAFSVQFGAIGVGATLAIVENHTGQDLIVKVNGSLALNNIPNGTAAVIAQTALPTASKLTAISLTTTATQSGAGLISYRVFGDPV